MMKTSVTFIEFHILGMINESYGESGDRAVAPEVEE